MKCPVCGAEKTIPADRVGLEKLHRYVWPFAPHRCRDCWNRFWRFDKRLAMVDAGILCAAGIVLWGALAVVDYLRTPDKPPVEAETGTARRVLVKREAGAGTAGSSPRMIPPPTEPYSDPPNPDSSRAATPDPPISAPPSTSSKGGGPPPLPSSVTETTFASSPPAPVSPFGPGAVPKPEPVKPGPVAEAGVTVKPGPAGPVPSETGKKDESPAKPEQAPKPEPLGKPEAPDKSSGSAPVKAGEKPAPSPSAVPPEGLRVLSGLAVEKADRGIRVSLTAGSAIAGWKSFYLKDPSRLVIDVPGEWRVDVPGEVPGAGKPVRTLRVAAHPGFLRVVADLDSPSAPEPVVSAESHAGGLRLRIQ